MIQLMMLGIFFDVPHQFLLRNADKRILDSFAGQHIYGSIENLSYSPEVLFVMEAMLLRRRSVSVKIESRCSYLVLGSIEPTWLELLVEMSLNAISIRCAR